MTDSEREGLKTLIEMHSQYAMRYVIAWGAGDNTEKLKTQHSLCETEQQIIAYVDHLLASAILEQVPGQ